MPECLTTVTVTVMTDATAMPVLLVLSSLPAVSATPDPQSAIRNPASNNNGLHDTAGWGSSELCPSPCVLAQPEPSAPRCFYGAPAAAPPTSLNCNLSIVFGEPAH
jgi:hypothetical protein